MLADVVVVVVAAAPGDEAVTANIDESLTTW